MEETISPTQPALQTTTPMSSALLRPMRSASQLHMKPPKNWPTVLMMLNADCQSAGRMASPPTVYLDGLSYRFPRAETTGGNASVPKVASKGRHRDHGPVDLGVKPPIHSH